MYKKFQVELQFRSKIYGGLSKSEEQLRAYVKAKFDSDDIEPTATDLDLQEELDKRTVGFKCDDIGVYIGSYQIKSMLSEAASLLGFTVKKRGSKQTLKEGLIIRGMNDDNDFTGEKVYFLPLRPKPDGEETHAGRVTTAQGSRSILKTMEYVEKAHIKFEVILLANRIGDDNRAKKLTVEDFKTCLAHGRELGLGSHRKYESGKFDVVKFEDLGDADASEIVDF